MEVIVVRGYWARRHVQGDDGIWMGGGAIRCGQDYADGREDGG
jgi:hypothetical protein